MPEVSIPEPMSDQPVRRGRLTSEARGLVEDVKKWVDLKVQLLQIDLEERLEGMLNRIAQSAVMAVLVLLTVLFGLFSIAYGLGAWWYSDALGFLAVTLLLAITTVTFYAMRPTLVKLRRMQEVESAPELEAPVERGVLPAPHRMDETPEPGQAP